MIWGDKKIRKKMLNAGKLWFGKDIMINPASVNLCLGNSFLIPKDFPPEITLGDKLEYQKTVISSLQLFALKPGMFCLATTKEKIDMPDRVAAFVQGRSSIGRIGLTVQNAGFVDPGFTGHITLELVNESPVTIYPKPGYPVAQLVFFDVSPVQNPYAGKYNGQEEATGSRMFMDKQKYNGL